MTLKRFAEAGSVKSGPPKRYTAEREKGDSGPIVEVAVCVCVSLPLPCYCLLSLLIDGLTFSLFLSCAAFANGQWDTKSITISLSL